MTNTIKSFELGSVVIRLADDGRYYYVTKLAAAGYYYKYIELEDAEEVFMEQISSLKRGEI